jgi:hypothetical protein
MVCFRYIIVNTLNKGGNRDDDDKIIIIIIIIIIIRWIRFSENPPTPNFIKFEMTEKDWRTSRTSPLCVHYTDLKKKDSVIVGRFYHFWWQWRHLSSLQSAPTSVNVTYQTDTSSQIPARTATLSSATILQSFWVDSRILAWNVSQSLCTKFSLIAHNAEFAFWCEAERRLERLKKIQSNVTTSFVQCPTHAQLFHKLSHTYMFRHYCVILREIVVSTLPS